MQNAVNLCPENLVRKPQERVTAEKEMIQNVTKSQAPVSKVPTIPKKGI